MANGERSSGGHKTLGGGSNSKAAAAPNFMPFAEGQRNCVGQNLAKLEVLVLLATLLGHFRLELAPEVRACMLQLKVQGLWCWPSCLGFRESEVRGLELELAFKLRTQ